MPITKQELGLLALQSLKVIEGNDVTPETNDTLVIEQAYDNVYAKLFRMHLISWALTDSIPDLFIDPVVWLVAESRITVFDPDPETKNIILIKAGEAVKEITSALAQDYVPATYETQYF